jgi:hypothetical protein
VCLGGKSPSDTSGQNTGAPITSSGVLKNLWVVSTCTYIDPNSASACGFPLEVTVQVWINSVATPLTCTVTLTTFNQAFKCADTTDIVPVNAGDTLSVSTYNPPIPGGAYWNNALKMNVSVEKQ